VRGTAGPAAPATDVIKRAEQHIDRILHIVNRIRQNAGEVMLLLWRRRVVGAARFIGLELVCV
jgi:hypothetical protein